MLLQIAKWFHSSLWLSNIPFCDIYIYEVKVLVAQSCPTLCDPMDCSLPGFSVHGIFQTRKLEWVAIPFSRGSSWLNDWTQVPWIAGRFFTIWATREAQYRLMTSKWMGMVPDHWPSDEIGLESDPHAKFCRTEQDLFKFSFKVSHFLLR